MSKASSSRCQKANPLLDPLLDPVAGLKKKPRTYRQKARQDYRERIPVEGKFGQGKNGYGLNYIRAKTAITSEAWIKSIFMVMNLMVLIRLLCANLKKAQRRYNIATLVTRVRSMIRKTLSQEIITTHYAPSGNAF